VAITVGFGDLVSISTELKSRGFTGYLVIGSVALFLYYPYLNYLVTAWAVPGTDFDKLVSIFLFVFTSGLVVGTLVRISSRRIINFLALHWKSLGRRLREDIGRTNLLALQERGAKQRILNQGTNEERESMQNAVANAIMYGGCALVFFIYALTLLPTMSQTTPELSPIVTSVIQAYSSDGSKRFLPLLLVFIAVIVIGIVFVLAAKMEYFNLIYQEDAILRRIGLPPPRPGIGRVGARQQGG
jgi:hypothetical protein